MLIANNLQPPPTIIASGSYDLHTLIFVICCVILVVVFGAMFYSIFKHRKSLGHQPANFHASTAVEIAWAVVPFVIVILMVLPAVRAVVAMQDTSNADNPGKIRTIGALTQHGGKSYAAN